MIEPIVRNGKTEDYIFWAKETAGVKAVLIEVLKKSALGFPKHVRVSVVVEQSWDEVTVIRSVAENIRMKKPFGTIVDVIQLRPGSSIRVDENDGCFYEGTELRYSEDRMTNLFLTQAAIADEILALKTDWWADQDFLAALKMILSSAPQEKEKETFVLNVNVPTCNKNELVKFIESEESRKIISNILSNSILQAFEQNR